MKFFGRFSLICLASIFMIFACASYDVDTSREASLASSIKGKVNKDKVRKIRPHEKYESAPVYVDYSKSNPVLRHDDEYDEDEKYQAEDPFEEEVEFSDYQKMKQKQQSKRRMEQDHSIENKEKAPLSLW